jgi:outer membrane protein OmpA-like peptidoglycan-associated protein
MRSLIVPFLAVPLAFGVAPAFAQGNPSAEQIIKSLTPSGDVSKAGTRGIRLAPVQGPTGGTESHVTPVATGHAAVAAAKPAVRDTTQNGLASVNMTVNFANGSAELTPQAMHVLDALGTALSSDALANYRFRVEGHTDTVGSRDFNRALSERRAEAVVTYISTKFGVAAARLQPVGMGSDKPLVQTAEQVAEPRNRRVQVVNIGL